MSVLPTRHRKRSTFLLNCPLYHELREKLFNTLTLEIPFFSVLNNQDKLTIMFQPRGDARHSLCT